MYGELHMHVFMNGCDYKKAVSDNKDKVDTAHVRAVLAAYRDAGITFLRDGGDHYGAGQYARELAPEYGITYLTPIFAIHKEGRYGSVVGKAWRDMREARAYIAEVKAKHGDFIKIMTTGILDFNEYGVISSEELSYDEVRELVNMAHGEGLRVMSHTNGSRAVINAVRAGADSIEHGYYADREALAAIAETKTVWVPTVVTSANLLKSTRYPHDIVSRIAAEHLRNVVTAVRAGANVGLGSDAGAYMVAHAQGTIDEYNTLAAGVDDSALLDETLRRSENIIRGWKRDY